MAYCKRITDNGAMGGVSKELKSSSLCQSSSVSRTALSVSVKKRVAGQIVPLERRRCDDVAHRDHRRWIKPTDLLQDTASQQQLHLSTSGQRRPSSSCGVWTRAAVLQAGGARVCCAGDAPWGR